MIQDVIQYFTAHPVQLGVLVLTILLAAVGLWYVLYHHLKLILVTLLCAAGGGSGLLVLYRGFTAGMRDLMGVGAFLVIIFPIIFIQALRLSQKVGPVKPAGADAGHAKRAGA